MKKLKNFLKKVLTFLHHICIITIVPSDSNKSKGTTRNAEVAELADALDSKSGDLWSCGFDSHLRYHCKFRLQLVWGLFLYLSAIMLRIVSTPRRQCADCCRTSFLPLLTPGVFHANTIRRYGKNIFQKKNFFALDKATFLCYNRI